MGNNLKRYLVLSLFIMFFLLPPSNAFSVFGICLWDCKISTQAVITENYDGIDFIKDGSTNGFFVNTKYIKFPKDSIFIDSFDGKTTKFSIDFTKGGWKKDHWEYKAQIAGIEQINEWNYLVGNKKIYFPPIYEYIETIKGQEIYSESKIHIEYRKGELIFNSEIDYYDPLISNWNNGSLTMLYDFNENDINQKLNDSASNPNNHNGTISGSDTRYYETGLYNDDYGLTIIQNSLLSGVTSYDISNDVDFGGGTMFQTSFVYRANSTTAGSDEKWLDLTGAINIRFDNTEWEYDMNGNGNNGQMINYWYNEPMTPNINHNITFVYDGATCYLILDGVKDGIDTSCTGTINSVSNARIGSQNQRSMNGTLFCLGIWSDSYLTDSATSEFFDNCYNGYEVGGEPPTGDTCNYDSGNFIINCSESCTVDTAYSIGNNDIRITGSGKININEDITNCGNTLIKGTDSSNKCKVKVNNARFCT